MTNPIDVELIEAGVSYRDRSKDPDPRRDSPRYAVEIDRGFQAPVILGEGDSPAEAFERARAAWLAQPAPRKPSYEELETIAQTWQHIDLLRKFLRVMSVALFMRGETHDRSKLSRAEVDTFTEFTPKLKTCTYGSEEYKGYLAEMRVTLEHHYGHNRHHPEHFVRRIRGMNLVDIIEMFCDWWASSHRHADGDIPTQHRDQPFALWHVRRTRGSLSQHRARLRTRNAEGDRSMTNTHLEKTLRFYYEQWARHYTPTRLDTSDMFPSGDRAKAMQHVMWMCELALDFLKKPDEVDKAHRWLGFIQGTLWACGHYTIDEMRAHSTEPTDP